MSSPSGADAHSPAPSSGVAPFDPAASPASPSLGPAAAVPLAAQEPAGGPVALALPAGVHQLCSCGRSRHGWFCDGAHLGTGRVSHELRLEQAGTVLLCGCGRSRSYPLCDGRHLRPPRRWWWWPWS